MVGMGITPFSGFYRSWGPPSSMAMSSVSPAFRYGDQLHRLDSGDTAEQGNVEIRTGMYPSAVIWML